MSDDGAIVGRSGAIQSLRAELVEAVSRAPKVGLRFQPGPVEVTLEVAVTKTGGAKAGIKWWLIKWWLIKAGEEASRSFVRTQTPTLTLRPVFLNSSGELTDVLVSGVEKARDEDGGADEVLTGTE